MRALGFNDEVRNIFVIDDRKAARQGLEPPSKRT